MELDVSCFISPLESWKGSDKWARVKRWNGRPILHFGPFEITLRTKTKLRLYKILLHLFAGHWIGFKVTALKGVLLRQKILLTPWRMQKENLRTGKNTISVSCNSMKNCFLALSPWETWNWIKDRESNKLKWSRTKSSSPSTFIVSPVQGKL